MGALLLQRTHTTTDVLQTRRRYNTHRGKKLVTVHHLAWDKCLDDTFPAFDGKPISFRDYFQKNYNVSLKQKHPPLLAVKQADTFIYLPPELCYMTGLYFWQYLLILTLLEPTR